MKTIAITILGILMSISLLADGPDTTTFKSLDNHQIDNKTVLLEPNKKLDLLVCIECEIILKEEELKTIEIFLEEDGPSLEYTKRIKEIKEEIDELQSKIQTLN